MSADESDCFIEVNLRISCFQMSYNDGRHFLAATGVEVADDPCVKGT
jgi:hypothetical protein